MRTHRTRSRKGKRAIDDLIRVMAQLRSPKGCPWDREQDHMSLRYHAVEEVYELIDAIEARDDHEMIEELGDLLLQVIFHCQLGHERGAFGFEEITRNLVDKLVRRHPHVFGDSTAGDVAAVWTQWEKIKAAEKKGTRHHRASALDGIPRHLPALLRAEKLVKKARKAGLTSAASSHPIKFAVAPSTRTLLGRRLFELAAEAQRRGWSAEALLRSETNRRDRLWRKIETK